MVELVFGKVKAPHQGPNGTGLRGDGHKSAFDFGQLGDFPSAFWGLCDADHGAFADLFGRWRFVRQARLHGFESLASDADFFAIGANHQHVAGARFQHHGRQHIAVVGVVFQRVIDGIVHEFRVGGQHDEFFRASVELAALEIHDALAQGFVSQHLLARIDGGVDIQAARVSVLAVLGKNHLPNRFGHVFGVQCFFVGRRAQFERFDFGRFGLLRRDVFVVLHPLNDVELARARAFGVVDGVVGRGRFGQAGQHRGFGYGDFLQGLAKINFSRRGKTISPVAQENLVHVDLKDLVFAQQVFKFVSQQNFINLACEGFFRGQINVARHLHGDGRCALALHAAHIGQTGPQNAQVIDPAVLVKAVVFDRQDRVFHDLGDVFDGRELAPLLAKLAHQLAVLCEHAQRQLGLVIGQVRNVGQVGVGDHHGHAHHHQHAHQSSRHQGAGPQQTFHQPSPCAQKKAFWIFGSGGVLGGHK